MFLLRKLFGGKKERPRKPPPWPMKLRLDGDWRLVLRGMDKRSKLRLTPLMTSISPTEVVFRADWRWGQLKVGEHLVAELHLSPEEDGPTVTGRVTNVNKDPVDYIYSATIVFDKLTGAQRREVEHFLRHLRMRERMGGSTQHLV